MFIGDNEAGRAPHIISQPCVQEAIGVVVSRAPRHVTTLARFAALRNLKLLEVAQLLPAQVCLR